VSWQLSIISATIHVSKRPVTPAPKGPSRGLYLRAKCKIRCTKHRHDPPKLKRLSVRTSPRVGLGSFLPETAPRCLTFATTPRGRKRSSLYPAIRFLKNGGWLIIILPTVNPFSFYSTQGNFLTSREIHFSNIHIHSACLMIPLDVSMSLNHHQPVTLNLAQQPDPKTQTMFVNLPCNDRGFLTTFLLPQSPTCWRVGS